MCLWCNLVHLQHHFYLLHSVFPMYGYCLKGVNTQSRSNYWKVFAQVHSKRCCHTCTHMASYLQGTCQSLSRNANCNHQKKVNHYLTGKGRWRLDGLNVKSICDEHAASVVALGIATLACSQVQTTTTACIDSKKPTSLLVNRIV